MDYETSETICNKIMKVTEFIFGGGMILGALCILSYIAFKYPTLSWSIMFKYLIIWGCILFLIAGIVFIIDTFAEDKKE